MITLCCAPDWMKGGEPGFTNWSTLEVARVYIGHSHHSPRRTEEIKDDIFDLLSHVFTFQVAPLPEHYLDFANLAGKVAER